MLFEGDKRVLEDLKLSVSANYGEDEKGNPTTLPKQITHLWT